MLGRVGDRQGRQFVLVLSVVLMGAATVAIGLLPSYAAIGIWAPILLVFVRLFQGFSVGGEFVGSVTYLVETAPANRRGLAGSVANIGATVGMLLAAAAGALTGTLVSHSAELWRAPFLFGGVLALVAYLLRRHLPPEDGEDERDSPRRHTEPQRSLIARLIFRWPALQAFREAPRTMTVTLLFTCGYGVSNYLVMVFLPTFAREFAGVNESTALTINTAGQALALAVVPLAGWISDRWIRRRTLLALAFALQAVLGWELFQLVTHSGAAGLWIAQLLLAGLLATVMGTAPAMLAEQFPRGFRVSGHAFVLNAGIGLAGGTAPMVAVTLIQASTNKLAPAAYLVFGCVVAAIAAILLTDNSRSELSDKAETSLNVGA